MKLRVHHGDLFRPYAIPLGTVGVCLMLLPAVAFILLLALVSSTLTWTVSMFALLIGGVLYPSLQIAKRRNWFDFRPLTLYEDTFFEAERTTSPRA